MRSKNHNSDWVQRAQQIYAQIHSIASGASVRIGFTNSSAMAHAISKLRSLGFRKPLLANGRTWLQQQILTNEEAYVLLSPSIRLEFIVSGSPAYWNGYGARIDYGALHDFAQKAGRWVLQKTSPIWICVDFGLSYEPFVGLLDDLTSGGPALAENAEDLNATQSRAQEPNLDFGNVVRSLRRRGKL